MARIAVQARTNATITAFSTCGHQLIPWWRNMPPRMSCTYKTKIESKVNVESAGRRVSNSTRGCSSTHLRPVNSAIDTAMQKKVCATVACAVEIHGG